MHQQSLGEEGVKVVGTHNVVLSPARERLVEINLKRPNGPHYFLCFVCWFAV